MANEVIKAETPSTGKEGLQGFFKQVNENSGGNLQLLALKVDVANASPAGEQNSSPVPAEEETKLKNGTTEKSATSTSPDEEKPVEEKPSDSKKTEKVATPAPAESSDKGSDSKEESPSTLANAIPAVGIAATLASAASTVADSAQNTPQFEMWAISNNATDAEKAKIRPEWDKFYNIALSAKSSPEAAKQFADTNALKKLEEIRKKGETEGKASAEEAEENPFLAFLGIDGKTQGQIGKMMDWLKTNASSLWDTVTSFLEKIPFLGPMLLGFMNGKDEKEKEGEKEESIDFRKLPPPGPFGGVDNSSGGAAEKPEFDFKKLSHQEGLGLAKGYNFKPASEKVSFDGVRLATLESGNKFFRNILGITDELVITSCCDGKHSNGSSHYDGRGIDIRTKKENQGGEAGSNAMRAIEEKCTKENGWEVGSWKGNPLYKKIIGGIEYKAIIEDKGKNNEHIHFSIRSVETDKTYYPPMSEKYSKFLNFRNLIIKGESSGFNNPYDAFNRGSAGSAGGERVDLQSMTIGEILKRQALSEGDPNRIFAVGAYQMIPKTLNGAVDTLNIDKNAKFDNVMQDYIFAEYLLKEKRPALYNYLIGQSSDEAAAAKAARQEWACFQGPNGKGEYDGDSANNRATIPYAELLKAINTGLK